MRTGSSTLYYLLGDHLGSTSITTDNNGILGSTILYSAWGSRRWVSGSIPTNYQYTDQRLESSSWMVYFYNSRYYDPALGRFIQADTIVPGFIETQAWDRYIYVGNNPLNYIDPTGHGKESTDCGPDGLYCEEHRSSNVFKKIANISVEDVLAAIDDGFDVDDITRGLDVLNYLRADKDGWWNKYVDWKDPESVWRLLLTLAYTYEAYSNKTDDSFISKMTIAFSNQYWDLMDTYNDVGGFIYIGTMETLNIRLNSGFNDLNILNIGQFFDDVFYDQTLTIWSKTLRSNDPNAPYDFGSCPNKCSYTKGTGADQAIWVSKDGLAYIKSRYQFYNGK